MAARRIMRLAERHARALRPPPAPPRPQSIGQWRAALGGVPSTDLPDWSFLDGRPSPPWKGQRRRLQENEELARRALKLSWVLAEAAQRGGPQNPPSPQLRPKGSQYKPVATSKEQ